jgi:tetratricopeptide (TPR) repeat protein
MLKPAERQEDRHLPLQTMARLRSGRLEVEESLRDVVPHLLSRCPGCRDVDDELRRLKQEVGHWDELVVETEWSEAPDLWRRLEPLSYLDQLAAVENDETLHTWGLCRLLQRRSREAASERPETAAQLANLAVAISMELGEVYHSAWVRDLRGLCWACLGDARRVLGELHGAAEAFAAAALLRRGGPGYSAFEAEGLALEALLRRDQHRLGEAVALLDRAHAIYAGVAPPDAEAASVAAPSAAPSGGEPSSGEPSTMEPLGARPPSAEPSTAEPLNTEPPGTEPSTAEPLGARPPSAAPSTAEPLNTEPLGAEPPGAAPSPAEATPPGAAPAAGDPESADPHLAGSALAHKAWCLYHLGQPEAALALLEQAQRLVDDTREPRLAFAVRHGQVWAAIALGRTDAAEALLPAAFGLAERLGGAEPIGAGEAPAGAEPLAAVETLPATETLASTETLAATETPTAAEALAATETLAAAKTPTATQALAATESRAGAALQGASEPLAAAAPLAGGADRLRLRRAEARLDLALGETASAERALRQLVEDFLALHCGIDAALAMLDLAGLYLRTGAAEALRRLAPELLPVFSAPDVKRPDIDALLLLQSACQSGRLTAELARQLAVMLETHRRPSLAWWSGSGTVLSRETHAPPAA